MKKVLIIAFIMCGFAIGSSSNARGHENSLTLRVSLEPNTMMQDWYATTGVTRNSIGTNYSINIRVKGSQLYGGCVSISAVQVSNNGNWSSVSYYKALGKDCTYYVNVGSETYYFTI